MKRTLTLLPISFLFLVAPLLGAPAPLAEAQPVLSEQTVLGPGLYVFQTRTRSATCQDDFQTGYVSSFYAAINGIPGSRTMEMRLLNNAYWPRWDLSVQRGTISGAANMRDNAELSGRNTFEVRRDNNQFEGSGTRYYNARIDGEQRRCSVTVDVLLRRLDR